MTTRRHAASLAFTLPVALILSACATGAPDTTSVVVQELRSDQGDQGDSSTGEAAAATTGPGTEADPAGEPVERFDEAKPAVIQIIAEGTLRDPEVGMTATAGSGSGFLISADGLAVTNNHVVTGASTLEVYIGGDTTAHHASVVGASECSDLALIQVDVDEPQSFLEWADEEATPGLDVYAAGFPLGDP